MPFYGVQFHPEVTHTPHGVDILRNFLYEICGCSGTWEIARFHRERVRAASASASATARVICGLSRRRGFIGDRGPARTRPSATSSRASSWTTACCARTSASWSRRPSAITSTSTCASIDAAERFPRRPRGRDRSAGEAPPHRPPIHRSVQAEAASDIADDARFLAQGTLYPDVIESGHGHAGTAANIKLHHNVGGLPEDLGFELIEPLRNLFKDEVRTARRGASACPKQIVWRHPFPGPGLAVRILGRGDRGPRLRLLRECDEIVLEEIIAANLYRKTSQVFAVLLPDPAVGVMGDGRSYESGQSPIRAVETQDFMTADWAHIPYDVLATHLAAASSTKSRASTAWSTTSPASPRRRSSGSKEGTKARRHAGTQARSGAGCAGRASAALYPSRNPPCLRAPVPSCLRASSVPIFADSSASPSGGARGGRSSGAGGSPPSTSGPPPMSRPLRRARSSGRRSCDPPSSGASS